MTLIGRITIIKSLALAKLIHLFLVLPNPPEELVKHLEKIFHIFLWNSGQDRIKRRVIIKEVTGELRMININTFIKGLHVSWFRCIIIQSDNASWYSVSNIDFGKLLSFGSGYIKTALTNILKPLWKDILNDWVSSCNSIAIERPQDILDAPLWYNKKLINGNGFCIYEWYRKGIRHVSDLLDEQGNIKIL